MKTMKETGYGVLLVRHDKPNSGFLAFGSGRFFSFDMKAAKAFRDELESHVSSKGKVVKVEVTYRVIP